MTWRKPDTAYWNNKFAAYWHDPIDKVFSIQNHEERAADYLQIFGLDRPNDEFWKIADVIAAGFERGQVPTYNADDSKSGAVDFSKTPIITHPTSAERGILKITENLAHPDQLHSILKEFLGQRIGQTAGNGDYANRFKGDPARFAVARLMYTHLVLRFILAEKNIGGIGALWHRIPADSRFPDHSIWQHNALCSAISSCIELGGSAEEVGLMVFSITPVQGFIVRARKMRDYWAGSVLLSWLAFEGLRWVMENLGVDHVLYPSLIDQPLINAYLEKEWEVSGPFKPEIWKNQPSEIASLPNKFLFLSPFGKVENIALELQNTIADKWMTVGKLTAEYLIENLNIEDESRTYLETLLSRQTSNFWDFQWAATRLSDHTDKQELEGLLDEDIWKNQFAHLEAIKPILALLEKKLEKKLNRNVPVMKNSSRGILYSTCHSLVQSALAAEKSRRSILRQEEPGEKCQMCGEFEVLHSRRWNGENAAEYSANLKAFWEEMNQEQKGDVDFKENERLCSICLIKRLAPRIMRKSNDHILYEVFDSIDGFPSTTEMALHDYFQRQSIHKKKQKEIAQKLHEQEERVPGEKIENRDKYYAILFMDGDHMGKLINGETIASTWEKIMHPDIASRLKRDNFDHIYQDVWRKIYGNADLKKRLVTPAIHAAISEALGDFSIYGVASIIKKNEGRLIYAGGDDVCAFLPIGTAVSAAKEIRKYYSSVFQLIGTDRTSREISGSWIPEPGKLSVNLGEGSDISISAAILICHHKESLTQMIERAHQLLNSEAKEKAGRNACAIELRKRHGGSRTFARKWSDTDSWNAFEYLRKMAGGNNRQISHSLLYRLETLRPGIEAIIRHDQNAEENLKAFVFKQIERSGTKTSNQKELAASITSIVWDKASKENPLNTEGLIIAGFLGGGEGND
ncbi:CRISPR-associated protein, Cmr2 family [Syntrophus gentianae]|uniref:CRISPR-associated protein, Cmr2 family n=1 Tax=Syntrophus gentianae TaxID=43775 RepID=A0A1H7ZL36_9BACT|nr:type III-B CRISPR-associated protein Cas10/Cmr2 [Syntrophus gentianae]SEM58654.1 CRISPR-associated protein, Cmr2 family [Syntrophus gentianae]